MTDQEVLGRVKAGREFLGSQALKEVRTASRYRTMLGDPTNSTSSVDNGQPLGQINYPAINARQKVSSTAYTAPDFLVKCGDPENSERVRTVMRSLWTSRGHMRTMKRTLMRRVLSGMAWVTYLWDAKDGFVVDPVRARDLAVDPHVKDETWDTLRWGARRVVLPAWVAEQRYPGLTDRHGIRTKPSADGSDRVEIWTYWDDKLEVEIYDDEVIKRGENLYGEVPILTFQGGIDPEGEMATGDYDEITGASEMLRRLQMILNDAATHHGGYMWVRSEAVDEAVKQQLMAGNWRGVVPVDGVSGDEAMGYVPAMPLSGAVMDALRYVSNGIDADQGVPQYSRGVVSQPAKFATEAMMVQSSSGARGSEARADYEAFCSRVADRHVRCVGEFGNPEVMGEDLWRAFADVIDVRVIEESASYKDPAAEQAAALQLLQTMQSVYPLFVQAAQAGLVTEVPNLKPLVDDVLRHWRKRELEQYWAAAPQPAPQAAPPEQVGGAVPPELAAMLGGSNGG